MFLLFLSCIVLDVYVDVVTFRIPIRVTTRPVVVVVVVMASSGVVDDYHLLTAARSTVVMRGATAA